MNVQLDPARAGVAIDVSTARRAGNSVEVSGLRRGVNWSSGYITVEDEDNADVPLVELTKGVKNEVAFFRNSFGSERGEGAEFDSGQ